LFVCCFFLLLFFFFDDDFLVKPKYNLITFIILYDIFIMSIGNLIIICIWKLMKKYKLFKCNKIVFGKKEQLSTIFRYIRAVYILCKSVLLITSPFILYKAIPLRSKQFVRIYICVYVPDLAFSLKTVRVVYY